VVSMLRCSAHSRVEPCVQNCLVIIVTSQTGPRGAAKLWPDLKVEEIGSGRRNWRNGSRSERG
jgi:hypothetical protein